MTDEIRIDDLAAPVLNDVQRMGIEYGESKATELSVDAVCADATARTDSTTSGRTTSPNGSACSSRRWTPTTTGPAWAAS